jgi:hypothetical protein
MYRNPIRSLGSVIGAQGTFDVGIAVLSVALKDIYQMTAIVFDKWTNLHVHLRAGLIALYTPVV